ncbi:MAG TPA: hypothetical protein PKY44_06990 [Bacteroidales bacterium]|nr:hypothetical protein [Bacteroidales bacterium]
MRWFTIFISFLIIVSTLHGQGRLTINDGVVSINGGAVLSVNEPSTVGITLSGTGTGYIQSESDINRVFWRINNSTGTYVIPFGYSGTRLNFTYQITNASSSSGGLIASTKAVTSNNTPYPTVSPTVTHMNSSITGTDASLLAADRFWILRKEEWTTEPTATLTFTYRDAEIASPNTITEANLVAQFWGIGLNNGSTYSWIPDMFDLSHGYGYLGTVNTTTNTVSGVSLGANNGGFYTWVLVDKNNPLPVTIIYFKVECNGAYPVIEWQTASEINCDYYLIERSYDAKNWQTVAYIQGAGTTSTLSNYSYVDDKVDNNTIVYYRLTQYDYDNSSAIIGSDVVMCNSSEISQISINIDNDNCIIISLHDQINEPYFINLYDINGKLIKRVTGNCENDYEKIIINTDDLAPAIYLIDVYTKTNKEIKKLEIM